MKITRKNKRYKYKKRNRTKRGGFFKNRCTREIFDTNKKDYYINCCKWYQRDYSWGYNRHFRPQRHKLCKEIAQNPPEQIKTKIQINEVEVDANKKKLREDYQAFYEKITDDVKYEKNAAILASDKKQEEKTLAQTEAAGNLNFLSLNKNKIDDDTRILNYLWNGISVHIANNSVALNKITEELRDLDLITPESEIYEYVYYMLNEDNKNFDKAPSDKQDQQVRKYLALIRDNIYRKENLGVKQEKTNNFLELAETLVHILVDYVISLDDTKKTKFWESIQRKNKWKQNDFAYELVKTQVEEMVGAGENTDFIVTEILKAIKQTYGNRFSSNKAYESPEKLNSSHISKKASNIEETNASSLRMVNPPKLKTKLDVRASGDFSDELSFNATNGLKPIYKINEKNYYLFDVGEVEEIPNFLNFFPDPQKTFDDLKNRVVVSQQFYETFYDDDKLKEIVKSLKSKFDQTNGKFASAETQFREIMDDKNYSLVGVRGDGNCYLYAVMIALGILRPLTFTNNKNPSEADFQRVKYEIKKAVLYASILRNILLSYADYEFNEFYEDRIMMNPKVSNKTKKEYFLTEDFFVEPQQIEILQKIFNYQSLILLPKPKEGKYSIEVQCSLPINPDKPNKFIIFWYTGIHYDLVKYGREAVFDRKDLPKTLTKYLKQRCRETSEVYEVLT